MIDSFDQLEAHPFLLCRGAPKNDVSSFSQKVRTRRFQKDGNTSTHFFVGTTSTITIIFTGVMNNRPQHHHFTKRQQ